MRTARRITVIAALCFVLTGIILMICGAGMAGFKIEKLFNDDRKRNSIEIKQKFDSVDVNAAIDNIEFIPSEDSTSTIELYESSRSYYDVRVEDNTLKISYKNDKKWYEYLSFGSFTARDIKVLIPAGKYLSIKAQTGIGNITIPESFKADIIETSTGIGNIKAPKAAEHTNINSGIGDITVPKSEISENAEISTGIGQVNRR